MATCRTFNAYGALSTEETELQSEQLLYHILMEMRIMNMQLAILTDNEITTEDLDPFEEL